jgi:hypothetical protein
MGWCGLDWSGSVWGRVDGCCEHGNELSGSIKCWDGFSRRAELNEVNYYLSPSARYFFFQARILFQLLVHILNQRMNYALSLRRGAKYHTYRKQGKIIHSSVGIKDNFLGLQLCNFSCLSGASRSSGRRRSRVSDYVSYCCTQLPTSLFYVHTPAAQRGDLMALSKWPYTLL